MNSLFLPNTSPGRPDPLPVPAAQPFPAKRKPGRCNRQLGGGAFSVGRAYLYRTVPGSRSGAVSGQAGGEKPMVHLPSGRLSPRLKGICFSFLPVPPSSPAFIFPATRRSARKPNGFRALFRSRANRIFFVYPEKILSCISCLGEEGSKNEQMFDINEILFYTDSINDREAPPWI